MRIVIAEDEVVERRILENHLREWGHDVVVTKDGTEAWDVLRKEDAPRLALLNWDMPGLDGPEICRRVRSAQDGRFLYLIILTHRDKKADTVAALEAGADDFIGKPYDSTELQARLNVGQRIVQLNQKLEAANKKLSILAHTDSLTQTFNRNAIITRLGEELRRAIRESHPLTVIMGDLDHFKQVNDTYGHVAGDQVLAEVARRLKSACRVYDAVGRYGGEEFLCLVPNADVNQAQMVAERLHAAVGESLIEAEGVALHVTISMGAVWIVPRREWQGMVDSVVMRADTLLYRAKEQGRDKLVFEVVEEVG